MGWETRNGRKYYYRKVREGEKVRSVYVGSDLAAAWQAESQLRARRKRDVRVLNRWLAPRARLALDQFDRKAALAGEMIRRVTEVVLHHAGYHWHKGEWRRNRNLDFKDFHDGLDADPDSDLDSSDFHDGLDTSNSQGEAADQGNPCEGKGEGDGRDDGEVGADVIAAVLHKAASPGTRRAWELVFRELLRDHPELWRDPNGPAHEAALALLREGRARVAARQLPHDSTLVLEMANLETELNTDGAQGLERLLIEAVLLAFMRQRVLQAYYGQERVTIALAKQTAEWEKRIRQARRAYEQARRALQRVRGLAARRREPLQIAD